MSDDGFAVEHDTDEQYEYDHRDGTTVKVRFDAHENGASVSTYWYEQGDRVAYHSFRVNNVDTRTLTHQTGNTDTVPEAIHYALRSGGWTVPNLQPQTIVPDADDPLAVSLLDARDGFSALASDAKTEAQALYYESFSRAVEIALVQELTLQQVLREFPNDDPQDVVDRTMERVKDSPKYEGTAIDEFGTTEHVEGMFTNAVRPETQNSTQHHDRFVTLAEAARDMYKSGTPFDEAWETAIAIHGDEPDLNL